LNNVANSAAAVLCWVLLDTEESRSVTSVKLRHTSPWRCREGELVFISSTAEGSGAPLFGLAYHLGVMDLAIRQWTWFMWV